MPPRVKLSFYMPIKLHIWDRIKIYIIMGYYGIQCQSRTFLGEILSFWSSHETIGVNLESAYLSKLETTDLKIAYFQIS